MLWGGFVGQPDGIGRLTCRPVFWALLGIVRASVGNGPESQEFEKMAVVLSARSGSARRKTRNFIEMAVNVSDASNIAVSRSIGLYNENSPEFLYEECETAYVGKPKLS